MLDQVGWTVYADLHAWISGKCTILIKYILVAMSSLLENYNKAKLISWSVRES